jgi:hypothetical protein
MGKNPSVFKLPLKSILGNHLAAFILALYLFVIYFFDIGCPIKSLTGLACPTCGLSRAYGALLNLDLKTAFYYHPLFWFIPVVILFYIHTKKPVFGSKKRELVFLLFALFLVVLVYLIRFFFGDGTVVTKI